jgi:CheY-like chemotaxis protein
VPATPPAAEPPAISFRSPAAPDRAAFPSLRLNVLVVDDNRDAADTLAGLLLLCGAAVRVCYGGEYAVQVAGEFRPDVGLFDVNMPGLDGCALARRVRTVAGDRPLLLVAVTGVGDYAAMCRTAAAGFNMHLTKPADPRELVATLAEFDAWLRAKRGTMEGSV